MREAAMSAPARHRSSSGRRIGRAVVAVVLGAGALLAVSVAPAGAGRVCNTDGGGCVYVPDVVQTPVGPVTITVTPANVVTVQLAPAAPNTLVFGVPFAYPPGPPVLPGYARTTFDTAGGLVVIDTVQLPPGPPTRPARPSLAVISIHPPSPCRVTTTGLTVVFTPVMPPGPPT
jgi:hypothetical protein